MSERLLADAVVVVHLLFIAFVMVGGFAALRWPRLALAHLPAAGWAVLVEASGCICPLTPLENRLRQAAGDAGYSSSFVDHYLLPIIYPAGLTRSSQWALAALVLLVNLVAYGWLLHRRRRMRDTSGRKER